MVPAVSLSLLLLCRSTLVMERSTDKHFQREESEHHNSRSKYQQSTSEDRPRSPSVEPTPQALQKEATDNAIRLLQACGLTNGPRAKYTLVRKERKGNPCNKIFPSQVGATNPPSYLNVPSKADVVGPLWDRKPLPDTYTWGEDRPFVKEHKGSSSTSGVGGQRDLERQKTQRRVKEFHLSVRSTMTDLWPEVCVPKYTKNIYEGWVTDYPISMKTPRSAHHQEKSGWKRWPFLLNPMDFPLSHYRIHLILSMQAQHHLNFDTHLGLLDKPTGVALQAECDVYGQFNRGLGDVSNTPVVLTRTQFNAWEYVPIVLLRRRPVHVLMDWIFDSSEGYWSLPVRVNPFQTTVDTVHPDYAKTSLEDLYNQLPPSTSPDVSIIRGGSVASKRPRQEDFQEPSDEDMQ